MNIKIDQFDYFTLVDEIGIQVNSFPSLEAARKYARIYSEREGVPLKELTIEGLMYFGVE